jgi:hypothetical protein
VLEESQVGQPLVEPYLAPLVLEQLGESPETDAPPSGGESIRVGRLVEPQGIEEEVDGIRPHGDARRVSLACSRVAKKGCGVGSP